MKNLLKSLSLAIALFATATAAHAADVTMTGHKALYKMSLASSKSTSIVSVTGEMLYDFSDTCDAWSTEQKFSLDYIYSEEAEAKMNSQYSSHENKNGISYDFAVRRTKNGAVEEEYVGSANRDPDKGGKATYTKPDQRQFDLPKGFLFPTQHTIEILTKAIAGEHIFNSHLFDGSDGTGDIEVNVIIGNVVPPVVDSKLADNPLLKSPARKVRLAFFHALSEKEKSTDDQDQPDYEMTMILHENGVVSSMQVDYDQFSLKGELQAIESVKVPKC